MVCVRKKDFRGLNQKTLPDSHPLPRIQELLDSFGGQHLVLY